MKSSILLAGLVCCFLAAGASAMAEDLSGKWQVEFHTDSNTSARPLCTFQQKDNQISGSCKGPHSEGPASGTVSGRAIQFSWRTGNQDHRGAGDGQMQSGGGVWTFSGTLGQDGVVTGSGTAPTGETGQFTAKRQ